MVLGGFLYCTSHEFVESNTCSSSYVHSSRTWLTYRYIRHIGAVTRIRFALKSRRNPLVL